MVSSPDPHKLIAQMEMLGVTTELSAAYHQSLIKLHRTNGETDEEISTILMPSCKSILIARKAGEEWASTFVSRLREPLCGTVGIRKGLADSGWFSRPRDEVLSLVEDIYDLARTLGAFPWQVADTFIRMDKALFVRSKKRRRWHGDRPVLKRGGWTLTYITVPERMPGKLKFGVTTSYDKRKRGQDARYKFGYADVPLFLLPGNFEDAIRRTYPGWLVDRNKESAEEDSIELLYDSVLSHFRKDFAKYAIGGTEAIP